ncbi:MAG: MBL fold metallo-hydrolase [Bacteroidetes bacterium]|nr:MBL fold metallo-hydrolase [Bacteroidota bacterium]
MIQIHSFTFNPFQENTYVLSDETKECVIIDPGCYTEEEKSALSGFISDKGLKPVKLLLTHAHIDHVLGNNYLCGKYKLKIEMNVIEKELLKSAELYGEMWGIKVEPSPAPEVFLAEGDEVKFGNSTLQIIFTPGHSPGSICFYNPEGKFIIAGDVLFHGSIGRTDLPGGDYDTLIRSITEKVFPLGDEYKVYPGHGPSTTIAHEKKFNPFVGENA